MKMNYSNVGGGILLAIVLPWALCAAENSAGAPVKGADMKIAIIKADDVRGPTEKWKRFIALSKERNVKVSCGIICCSLEGASSEYTNWLRAEEKSGWVEFWNHGWDHKRWEKDGHQISEFDGSGYAHQKEHFVKAQEILKSTLGHPNIAFGTPFNSFDNDTARVLTEDHSIKVLFSYKDRDLGNITVVKMALRGEPDGTGKPNAAEFAKQYDSMKDKITVVAIQFHPNSFKDDSCFDEYTKTLDILLKDGWTFMLPSEYVHWRAQHKTTEPN